MGLFLEQACLIVEHVRGLGVPLPLIPNEQLPVPGSDASTAMPAEEHTHSAAQE